MHTYGFKTSSDQTGLTIYVAKCSGVRRQSFEAASVSLYECYRAIKTNPEIGMKCGTMCDNGYVPECVAKLEWQYLQCTTCCCKGGESYFLKKPAQLSLVVPGSQCGMWFLMAEAVVGTIATIVTRLDSSQWSSRCVKL